MCNDPSQLVTENRRLALAVVLNEHINCRKAHPFFATHFDTPFPGWPLKIFSLQPFYRLACNCGYQVKVLIDMQDDKARLLRD